MYSRPLCIHEIFRALLSSPTLRRKSYTPQNHENPVGHWKLTPHFCSKGSTSSSSSIRNQSISLGNIYIFQISFKVHFPAHDSLTFFGSPTPQGTCDLPAEWHCCWDVLARPGRADQVGFWCCDLQGGPQKPVLNRVKFHPCEWPYKWGFPGIFAPT